MEKYKQDVIISLICKHGCPMRMANSWTHVLVCSHMCDFLRLSPAKTKGPPNADTLLADDIGFHSLGKAAIKKEVYHRVHTHTHTLITLIYCVLCAITSDFKSRSIWQKFTNLGVSFDISRCTCFWFLLNVLATRTILAHAHSRWWNVIEIQN